MEDPVSGSSVSVSNAVDHDGHGTHVSGIAASSNPAIGVAYGAKLVDIKVIADSNESQLGGDPVLRVDTGPMGVPGLFEFAEIDADT